MSAHYYGRQAAARRAAQALRFDERRCANCGHTYRRHVFVPTRLYPPQDAHRPCTREECPCKDFVPPVNAV